MGLKLSKAILKNFAQWFLLTREWLQASMNESANKEPGLPQRNIAKCYFEVYPVSCLHVCGGRFIGKFTCPVPCL